MIFSDRRPSLRTADVSPRSSPLRDGSRFLLAERPSAAMSEEKRLSFAGYRRPQYFISHTKSQRSLVMRHRLSNEKVNLHNVSMGRLWCNKIR